MRDAIYSRGLQGRIAEAVAAWNAGRSMTALSLRLKVSRARVYQYLDWARRRDRLVQTELRRRG